MKVSVAWLLFAALLLLVGNEATIMDVLQADPTFGPFYSAILACGCLPYTNSQGIFNTERGNLLAVNGSGAAGLGNIDETRLGQWFFSNVTLNAPIVPIPLNTLTNDQVLPTRTGSHVRFNVYGNVVAANGVKIDQEINITSSKQIIWRTNATFVVVLNEIPAWSQIQGDLQLTSFTTAIGQADSAIVNRLGDTLTATTIFSPIESAFTNLVQSLNNRFDLFASAVKVPVRARLTRIVNYHLLASTFWKIGLTNRAFTTLNGQQLTVSGNTITDTQGRTANIVTPDDRPFNGVIHKLDNVLLPEPLPTFATTMSDWDTWAGTLAAPTYASFRTASQAGNPSFFTQYLSNTSATGYTFIGPTTFTAGQFLNYLIPGVYFSNQLSNDLVLPTVGGSTIRFNQYESWYVNGRPLNNAYMDWTTVNGAFHVYANAAAIPFFTLTVWDRIPAAHPFKTALQNAGFQTMLSQPGAFTVLLPSQTAWNAITNPSIDLIKYHIVTSTIFKYNPQVYPTYQGATVTLNVTGFNGIGVQAYDVVNYGATNGMVLPLGGVLPSPPIVSTTSSNQVTGSQTTASGSGQSTTGAAQATGANINAAVSPLVSFVLLFVAFVISILL